MSLHRFREVPLIIIFYIVGVDILINNMLSPSLWNCLFFFQILYRIYMSMAIVRLLLLFSKIINLNLTNSFGFFSISKSENEWWLRLVHIFNLTMLPICWKKNHHYVSLAWLWCLPYSFRDWNYYSKLKNELWYHYKNIIVNFLVQFSIIWIQNKSKRS